MSFFKKGLFSKKKEEELKFQKGEEDKGEGDSAADDEVRAIEDNADGANAEDGDNNNEDTFDLGHQQQQQPQESSTPTPDARTGTAGSRKLQPASMQPTVMEDTESENEFGAPGVNLERQQKSKTNASLKTVVGDEGRGGEGNGGRSESEEESEEDDDDDDDVAAPPIEGTYDPSEYENLNVSQEIKELFAHVMRYTPQTIDLETRFKPFIPEYIPAVGDIDAFIKVTRPDGKKENLGLTMLDEPAAKQSDPSVLELQLRAISKQSSAKSVQIRKIDSGEKSAKEIDKWIKDISDLHRSKPPPTVHYTKPMPDIDRLMQEWPPEVEEMLKETGIPTAEYECSIATYVDICCALLDIPVYKSRIQSLHVLFTLYSAFRNSQHFNQLAHDDMENINSERIEF